MSDLVSSGIIVGSIEEMVSGAGAGIKSSSVAVKHIKVGSDINPSENAVVGFIDANIAVKIEFNAGYSIGGEYTYTSKSNVDSVNTHAGLVKYAEAGLFELDIAYSKDDDMPFNNWWVCVAEDEELLKSISEVGSVDYDEDSEQGSIGEAFSYDYFDANQQVAYQMLHDLTLDNGGKKTEPYTQDFADDLHSKIRAAIAAALSLHL